MIKAIHNNVVLQLKTNQMQGSIYMPKSSDDSFIVLNIGSEVSTIKIGSVVILREKPQKYNDGLNDYYITPVDNIIAIVEDTNE